MWSPLVQDPFMNWVEAETTRSSASLPRRLVNLQLLSWLSCVQAWTCHELSTICGSRSHPRNLKTLRCCHILQRLSNIIKCFLDEHSNWISLGFFWDWDWYRIGHMLRIEEMTSVGCTGSTLRGWQFQKAASWPSCRADTLVDATIWMWSIISMDVPSKTDTDW